MKNRFDERQVAARYKFGYQSFFLSVVLMMVNMFIADLFAEWADTAVYTLVIFWISFGYFGVRSIWADAFYEPDRPHMARLGMWLFLILAVIMLGGILIMAINGEVSFVSGGKATRSLPHLFAGAIPLSWTVLFWIKRAKDRSQPSE